MMFPFKRKKTVTVNILHRRPTKFPSLNVKFLRSYTVEAKDNVDVEKIMREAFAEVHPEWPIVEVKVS